MPKPKSTPLELFMDWLSNQPGLVLKTVVMKKADKLHQREEINHLKAAYAVGYDNYSHPKNYTIDASEWYARKYKRSEKIGCRKPKPFYKPKENVTTKPTKSLRKRDLH